MAMFRWHISRGYREIHYNDINGLLGYIWITELLFYTRKVAEWNSSSTLVKMWYIPTQRSWSLGRQIRLTLNIAIPSWATFSAPLVFSGCQQKRLSKNGDSYPPFRPPDISEWEWGTTALLLRTYWFTMVLANYALVARFCRVSAFRC